MSKPGAMVQLLREDYEEQLEAYRLLRNKFLVAVPGMNLDKEKLMYEHWKTDLHLNSIIDFERKAKDDGKPEPGDLVISASSQAVQWNGLPDPWYWTAEDEVAMQDETIVVIRRAAEIKHMIDRVLP